jgi:ankyrin repeat protein
MHKNKEELIRAAALGKHRRVISSLKTGANVNAHDTHGRTALHWASQEGHTTTVKLLIKHGARVDLLDGRGFSPLMLAIGEGHQKIVACLLAAGARVNQRCKPSDYGTALVLAAAWNRLNIVRQLVSCGAHVNSKDSAGRTPLFFAVSSGHFEVVKFLIKQGAFVDLNFRGRGEKKTLLELARATRDFRIVSALKATVCQ